MHRRTWLIGALCTVLLTGTAAAQTTASKPDLILDLFEPDSTSLKAQQSDTALSSQIEHTLVVSFLLTRCQLISQQDYSDTYNDLIALAVKRGMAPDYNAAATRIHAIADSAGASYALVYSRVPCHDPSLPPLVKTLAAWRDQSSSRTVSESSKTP